MVGNGNGMQYFGAILIESDRSLEELQTYYAEYDCMVMGQLSQNFDFMDANAPAFRHEGYDKRHFTVYRWGNAPDWLQDVLDTDLRGH